MEMIGNTILYWPSELPGIAEYWDKVEQGEGHGEIQIDCEGNRLEDIKDWMERKLSESSTKTRTERSSTRHLYSTFQTRLV